VNISALFIRRPVATALLAVAILISGALAYFILPVAPLPNIDYPVIALQASMSGASPEIMAATVAEPAGAAPRHHRRCERADLVSYVGSSRINLCST
jgi:multidrug efflux pump